MRIASAVIHRGEEPPLVTGKGSGTVFFTGCTLKCSFCQNVQISSDGMGTEVQPGTLKEICRALEKAGASNINLVTGSHFIPGIVSELAEVKKEGFSLPIVWNSSGFESPEGLEIIAPFIDVFLLDLKTVTPEGGASLFGPRGYPEAAKRTALFAAEQAPPVFRGEALIKGTIIRHLIMPGMEEETEKVIQWFGSHLAGKALFSLMVQYIDVQAAKSSKGNPSRQGRLLEMLDRSGIEDGFIQDPGDETPWIPDFNRWNPFPEKHSLPVWHWRCGFGESEPNT